MFLAFLAFHFLQSHAMQSMQSAWVSLREMGQHSVLHAMLYLQSHSPVQLLQSTNPSLFCYPPSLDKASNLRTLKLLAFWLANSSSLEDIWIGCLLKSGTPVPKDSGMFYWKWDTSLLTPLYPNSLEHNIKLEVSPQPLPWGANGVAMEQKAPSQAPFPGIFGSKHHPSPSPWELPWSGFQLLESTPLAKCWPFPREAQDHSHRLLRLLHWKKEHVVSRICVGSSPLLSPHHAISATQESTAFIKPGYFWFGLIGVIWSQQRGSS